MAENPFGDSAPQGEKRNYLVLISASKDNAALAQKFLKNIQSLVDKIAAPLWIDSKGAGVFVSTDLVASEIWAATLEGTSHGGTTSIKDVLVCCAGTNSNFTPSCTRI